MLRKGLYKIDNYLEKFAIGGLVVSVFLMMGLTMMNIILRNFQITFLWLDPLVRHLVFFSAFLGGALATSRNTHIGIDILSKIFEAKCMFKTELFIRRIIHLTCILGIIWLTKASLDFSSVEFEHGRISPLGIHSGYLVSIIPLGFIIIGYRFFILLVKSFDKEQNEKNND